MPEAGTVRTSESSSTKAPPSVSSLAAEVKPDTAPSPPSPSKDEPTKPSAPAAGPGPGGPGGPPGPPPPELPLARRVLLVACTMLVIVLGAGGQQGLNIALPSMQEELGIKQNDLQWISSAYGLASGCLVPLNGRLADVFGRKMCFIIGISWYALWNLVGSFLHNRIGVIVTRALAGMGASMG